MSYPTAAQFQAQMRDEGVDVCVERLLADELPFAFEGAPLDFQALRGRVFDGLAVPMADTTLVGSGRFGFSLDPNRWGTPFSDGSDLDPRG